MKLISIISIIATIIFAIIFSTSSINLFLTLSITFGTIAYHFSMRLIVGMVVNAILNNSVNYNRKWFKVSVLEQKFYKFIRINKWKKYMPTFSADTFNPKLKTWEQIAMATCQAEIVHEIIILLSFLPIIAYLWFGELVVFILTSIFSALFDLIFVFLQRYNRPRILKLINRTK